MSDFLNRVQAQRVVVDLVNERHKGSEELYGLSKSAIERWCFNNNLSTSSDLYLMLMSISEKLMFLANKSQQQITDNYKVASDQIVNLTANLKNLLSEQY